MSIFSKSAIAIALSATIGITTVGAAFAASTTNKGANPNGKPFVELQGQIIEVEGEVSTLQDQVDSLVDNVDDLQLRITANDDAIAALETTNADLQLQITANADDIASLEAQVMALENENADLQEQINDLGDADGSLQDQIDTNAGLITTLNQSISDISVSLQDQINNNNALIVIMQNQINNLNIVASHQTEIQNGVCPDGETPDSFDPTTQEFSCLRPTYDDDNGVEVLYPVTYKTFTIPANTYTDLFIGCDENHIGGWPRLRNLSYQLSGDISILGFQSSHFWRKLTVHNGTMSAQVVNMSAECVNSV